MERLIVEGGKRLNGEIDVHGAKNSSLPILAASLLYGGQTVLKNCPKLSDVDAAIKILTYLGCTVEREGDTVIINSDHIAQTEIPENLMHEMRSSIVFLGAIISRMGKATLSFPGGCELGPRPIDLHISSLQKLGVDIVEEYGKLCCQATNGLKGCKINLSFPSVGATENILLASVMSKGETIILNAAQEPEIIDLANYLNQRGARIKGAGKSTIVIEGVEKLNSVEYSVMPDRIVAITYLCGAAITGGDVLVNHINTDDIESVLPILEQAGCKLSVYSNKINISGPSIIRPVKNIRTMPYPGFPTDAQAPIMAMLTVASGTSMFVENIFESRYKHVGELTRMGADIKVEGKVAVVEGVKKLYGASVEATDLRGGAALVIAALAAQGVSKINHIYHIDRGYETIEEQFNKLGAKIIRE
ncbi:UDP-N-acetylglucosamine 1-carboxyvinyltransferase [Paludicola sp. MB14-C6]|uniref:UDP-N-acetylglucosamine 1-carboxyvinyltransferase n=1 Tax=Paludihabitans sp. MB14-C6 TaxID=3070656 RepID=UPI0027DAC331|nr:UDP-N-acetylglucosamine 1-carboxyvinyltransferase [Paludicola sp. MB14-C6]WMJ23759.1 UDP-N-acetylglucosamine 1-carboxyvinyltransferase [Paludicola sp. MB14-C6]